MINQSDEEALISFNNKFLEKRLKEMF